MNLKRRYHEAIHRLYGLQKYGIKFGLSKTANLLTAFDNPQEGQRYIHIAGTNGKGSVAAFTASVLQEAGLKVGLYSSPHLVRFTERFLINGEEMDQATAVALIDALDAVFVREEPPTFFEAVTAMALVYFAREKTDVAILEVGMGGRLDATNVITPLVCAITSIGMEHREFLGNRLRDIAYEKAGIIKPGVDVITAASQPSVNELIASAAALNRSPLWRLGKDVRYRSTQKGLYYTGPHLRLKGLEPGLKGAFQRRNAALALGIVERLIQKGYAISTDHIIHGLARTRWPGRMHVIHRSPLIIIDGAHNPSAIRTLAASIGTAFTYNRMILVMGVMADKALYPLLKGIVPMADYVIYSRPVYQRAAPPERLMASAAPFCKPGETADTIPEALNRAWDMADPRDMILVCGSLFTVGEALTYFDPVQYSPDE